MTGPDASFPVSRDGITPLPPGHIACIKTYLAMTTPPAAPAPPLPAGVDLVRLTGAAEPRYTALFATLGRRWLWWSRLQLTPAARAAILDDPGVEAYAIHSGARDIGLLELDFRDFPLVDLAFLGLVEGQTGRGLGRAVLAGAIGRCWSRPITQLTVNTCTFDHPAALGFYRSSGFAVLSQAIEVVPDPRRTGLLPEAAAPHVPLARPA